MLLFCQVASHIVQYSAVLFSDPSLATIHYFISNKIPLVTFWGTVGCFSGLRLFSPSSLWSNNKVGPQGGHSEEVGWCWSCSSKLEIRDHSKMESCQHASSILLAVMLYSSQYMMNSWYICINAPLYIYTPRPPRCLKYFDCLAGVNMFSAGSVSEEIFGGV